MQELESGLLFAMMCGDEKMFLDEMPKNGQFVRVWLANGEIWSDVMKWEGGTLMIYNKDADEFERALGILLDVKVIKYLTSV